MKYVANYPKKKEKYPNNRFVLKIKLYFIYMGIIVLDTIYCPMEIKNAYINIDSILTIKRKKQNNDLIYDVVTHYCCYTSRAELGNSTPFDPVPGSTEYISRPSLRNHTEEEQFSELRSENCSSTDGVGYKHSNTTPFHKVEITLTNVKDLNNIYDKLYKLIKRDFIKTKDVIE